MHLINLQLTVDHVSSINIYLEIFMLISFVVTEICSTQNSSIENNQRAITLELGSRRLFFLCSTLLLVKVYQPIKFHAGIFCSP